MRWALLSFHGATELLPHTIKQRRTQIALDSCVAAVAVLLAYALRFDFSVSASFARQMWRWSVAMAILRPASLIVFAGYKSIWRFLRVQDVAHLLLASLPPSLLLLSVRLAAHQSFWIAQVPRGVIVLESMKKPRYLRGTANEHSCSARRKRLPLRSGRCAPFLSSTLSHSSGPTSTWVPDWTRAGGR